MRETRLRRALSDVLFRGVVTPGLGMKESRAFFVGRRTPPRTPNPNEETDHEQYNIG